MKPIMFSYFQIRRCWLLSAIRYNLVLKGPFGTLIITIGPTKIAVYALIQFIFAAALGFPATFHCDSRITVSKPCLIFLSAALLDLNELVGVGAILRGTEFNLATSIFIWHTMRAVD